MAENNKLMMTKTMTKKKMVLKKKATPTGRTQDKPKPSASKPAMRGIVNKKAIHKNVKKAAGG